MTELGLNVAIRLDGPMGQLMERSGPVIAGPEPFWQGNADLLGEIKDIVQGWGCFHRDLSSQQGG